MRYSKNTTASPPDIVLISIKVATDFNNDEFL